MATVSVIDLADRSTFERQIPAVYLFHIQWIIQEAYPKDESRIEHRDRTIWLRAVLDCFAEEIRSDDDMSDWRSKVLNPVLVRALHRVNDFDEKDIARKAAVEAGIGRRKATHKHWEGFYLNLDVVAPVHHTWWLTIKHIEPAQHEWIEEPAADPCQGVIPSRCTF